MVVITSCIIIAAYAGYRWLEPCSTFAAAAWLLTAFALWMVALGVPELALFLAAFLALVVLVAVAHWALSGIGDWALRTVALLRHERSE